MKIVFCTQNMAPFRMKWMDEIAKYHKVVIYHLGEYGKEQNLKYISYNPQKAVVNYETKRYFLGYKGYDEKQILDEQADVYLLDGYGFRGQQHLIMTLRKKYIPFVMSVDGGFVKKNENIIKKCIKRFFVSSANAYFSTSKETDHYIDHYGGGGKVKYRHYFSNITNAYIENRPTTDEEKRKLKKDLGMEDKFSIIAVGKFEFGKGFDILLEAVKKLDHHLCVYFIGAKQTELYESYLTEEIADQVKFVDFCDPDTLKKYYRAAELLLLPTRHDVWGLVISEGMANGISVVTTDMCLAGVAMLEKNEIIPSDNIEETVNVIKRQMGYTEEERMKIGRRNIEKTREYSIENSTKQDVLNLERWVHDRHK